MNWQIWQFRRLTLRKCMHVCTRVRIIAQRNNLVRAETAGSGVHQGTCQRERRFSQQAPMGMEDLFVLDGIGGDISAGGGQM